MLLESQKCGSHNSFHPLLNLTKSLLGCICSVDRQACSHSVQGRQQLAPFPLLLQWPKEEEEQCSRFVSRSDVGLCCLWPYELFWAYSPAPLPPTAFTRCTWLPSALLPTWGTCLVPRMAQSCLALCGPSAPLPWDTTSWSRSLPVPVCHPMRRGWKPNFPFRAAYLFCSWACALVFPGTLDTVWYLGNFLAI